MVIALLKLVRSNLNYRVLGTKRAPGGSTGPIQMQSSMTFIRGIRCIERITIYKRKIAVVLNPSKPGSLI